MGEPLTDSELAEIERAASVQLRAGKFQPPAIVRLLAVSVPRLVGELRWQSLERARGIDAESRLHNSRIVIDELNELLAIARSEATELESQLAARDAQIARMRTVIEGAEVA